MCLTLLGFGKGTISGCARIIHAICIGPKIVAGSLFSILQSLGNFFKIYFPINNL